MTGEWEYKLMRMARGAMRRKEFMAQIRTFTREIVEKTKNFEGDSVSGDFETLNVKCPKCGAGPFDEDYRTFKCRSCGLIIWKTMAGRLFETGEVEQLLTQGRVGPLEGFRSKMGRRFNATVKLSEDFKQEFDFGEGGNGAPEKIDASRHESIGIVSQGETPEHAEEMIKEAVELWLECADESEVRRRLDERKVAIKELEVTHA